MSDPAATYAATYARVSTTEQELEGQKREIMEYASRLGLNVVREFDEKVSGTGKVDRAQYDRLMREAEDLDRKWSHLIVWALDRFSRADRFTRAIDAVLDLEAKGVAFHSLKEPMLDTPPDGQPNIGREILLAILPVIAKFEAIRHRERTQLAMAEIKSGRRRTRSGKPPGRPVRVTDEKVAEIVRWREKGFMWSKVAQKVRLPAGTCSYVYSLKRRGLWKPRTLTTVSKNGDDTRPAVSGPMPEPHAKEPQSKGGSQDAE